MTVLIAFCIVIGAPIVLLSIAFGGNYVLALIVVGLFMIFPVIKYEDKKEAEAKAKKSSTKSTIQFNAIPDPHDIDGCADFWGTDNDYI